MLSFLQVIWAIGWSLVVLAAVIHLPLRVIVVLSVAMIALHNTLDGIQVTTFAGPGTPVPGFGASLWKILHQQGMIFPFGSSGPAVVVMYPLIPWIAVMWAGYALGSLYERAEPERRRALLQLGAALIVGFLVIRAVNIYGDPSRWSVQHAGEDDALVPCGVEVSAVAAVPADDTRPGAHFSRRIRPRRARRRRAHLHHLRPRADVLLCAAVDHGALPRDRGDETGGEAG